jgi:glutamate 5-kinase
MRFVVKIGTSLVTTSDYELDECFLGNLAEQVSEVKRQGHEVVIVTSGAVASGRSRLCFTHEKKSIPCKQALAAIGQGILMKTYNELFYKKGFLAAQALLTNHDFTNRENFLNTRNILDLLLKQSVIPIVNENDVTTIGELKFGDNDMLSAKTAAMVSADFLIILTDVDGLFDSNPARNPSAKLIQTVPEIDEEIRSYAAGPASENSRGGMVTKLEAAAYVTSVGIPAFVANGRRKDILLNVVSNCVAKKQSTFCTFFPTSVNAIEGQKKWLKPKIVKQAWIEIDAGAAKAILKSGKSLLPSGIVGVRGKFNRGDVVIVKNGETDIAYGQVNYSAEDVDKIKKHRSDEISGVLGYGFEEEVIHRDQMVVSG